MLNGGRTGRGRSDRSFESSAMTRRSTPILWRVSMNRDKSGMDREMAGQYIRENFHPGDRLAVVLLNKRTNSVMQRVASAEKIISPDFQAWLRHQNAQRYE